MNVLGHEAVRAHGVIQLELKGGGLALLEVDIDVSGPGAYGVDTEYSESSCWPMCSPSIPISQTLSLKIPRGDIGNLGPEGAMLRVRVPAAGAA